MKKQYSLLIALVAATTISVGPRISTTVHADSRDKDIKLNGCLIKAEGDDDYLIANLPSEPGSSSAADGSVTTTAIGTAGSYANVFYWLGGDNDLKKHVGHRVEIEGQLKGDIKEGEIKLDHKDNWTELQVKSDGHSMKAQVPNAYIFPDPARDKDRKITAIVRRVDVDKVRMLAARCE
jgi:hypothetical protein